MKVGRLLVKRQKREGNREEGNRKKQTEAESRKESEENIGIGITRHD